MNSRTRLHRRLRALRADTSGLAMVEFAITLPVLLIVGLSGIEVANFAIANLRVSQIAMQTADNAARVRISIDESDVNEVMIGAQTVGAGINFGPNARVILSDLEPKTTGTAGQWIRWQRCYGAKNVASSYGVPKDSSGNTLTTGNETTKPSDQTKSVPTDGTNNTPTTGMGAAGNQVQSAASTAVMFVEVFYDYQPIVANRILGTRTLHYTAAYNVRQRTDQTMHNGGNLATSAISACSNFTS